MSLDLFRVIKGIDIQSDGRVKTGARTAYYGQSVYPKIYSSSTYDDNKWHFVTVTKEGTKHTLYVDGVNQGSTDVILGGMDIDQVTVGAYLDDKGKYKSFFDGNLDF